VFETVGWVILASWPVKYFTPKVPGFVFGRPVEDSAYPGIIRGNNGPFKQKQKKLTDLTVLSVYTRCGKKVIPKIFARISV